MYLNYLTSRQVPFRVDDRVLRALKRRLMARVLGTDVLTGVLSISHRLSVHHSMNGRNQFLLLAACFCTHGLWCVWILILSFRTQHWIGIFYLKIAIFYRDPFWLHYGVIILPLIYVKSGTNNVMLLRSKMAKYWNIINSIQKFILYT